LEKLWKFAKKYSIVYREKRTGAFLFDGIWLFYTKKSVLLVQNTEDEKINYFFIEKNDYLWYNSL
jgi:hypothetical protein